VSGTVSDSLATAMQLHQAGKLAEAEQAYGVLWEQFPQDANVAHFFGLLQFQLDRIPQALALLQQSLEADPDNSHAWNNLGNMYKHLGRHEDALEAYLRATSTSEPAPPAWYNLALHYLRARNIEAALHALRETTRRASGFVLALQTLGFMYYRLGRTDDALDVYKQWAAEAPDDPTPRHMLAAASGAAVPPRADDRYIVKTFNGFADHFDEKLQRLDYRAPQLVAGSLIQHPLYQSNRAVVLDAGCGTGLCGPLLKSTAGTLVGVDLSPNMLELAAARKVYDQLHEGELTAFLQSHPGEFDIVVSADVLCYFGQLGAFAEAGLAALKPGGLLTFSVEALQEQRAEEGYRMRLHGRYAHTLTYLQRIVAEAGFAAAQIDAAVLRQELGEPVQGYIVQARRPGAVQ